MILAPPSNSFSRFSTYALAADGDDLSSLAEAERVIALCSGVPEVYLDFQGVSSIGPDFARRIFHEWPKEKPRTKVVSIHACPAVARMIRRVHAGAHGPSN